MVRSFETTGSGENKILGELQYLTEKHKRFLQIEILTELKKKSKKANK